MYCSPGQRLRSVSGVRNQTPHFNPKGEAQAFRCVASRPFTSLVLLQSRLLLNFFPIAIPPDLLYVQPDSLTSIQHLKFDNRVSSPLASHVPLALYEC
jgi:hypothetical protein